MVHALIVIRGLLRPHGVLVDLRTDRFASVRARHDQVFCRTGTRRRYAGRIKITKPLADFRCADRAVREVLRRGLFRLEPVEVFENRSYLDSPARLDQAMAGQRYAVLEESTRRRLRALRRRYARSQIMIVARERLNVLVRT